MTVARSYLKWPGSKTRLLDAILARVPDVEDRKVRPFGRWVEPFAGSGVVALNLAFLFESVVLRDANADLVAAHRAVLSGEPFVAECRRLFAPETNTRAFFEDVRREFNRHADPRTDAARLLYLNRHSFNGLVRYNASGGFNAPFGANAKPYFPEAELRAFAARLAGADLATEDFRTVLDRARAGDVVYCDPPYLPLTKTASFAAYASGGFSLADHEDLAKGCAAAARRGATVLLSNHDTETARRVCTDNAVSEIGALQVSRSISCKGEGRGKAAEILAVFRPASSGVSALSA